MTHIVWTLIDQVHKTSNLTNISTQTISDSSLTTLYKANHEYCTECLDHCTAKMPLQWNNYQSVTASMIKSEAINHKCDASVFNTTES